MAHKQTLHPKDFTTSSKYFILLLLGLLLQVSHSQDCVNGVLEGNSCVCEPCWLGPNCNVPATQRPRFIEKYNNVYIKPDPHETIFTARAQDGDARDICVGVDTEKCACAQIVYSLESGGENFMIGHDTGKIEVKPDVKLTQDEYTVKVNAYNDGYYDDESDTMTLLVKILKSDPFTETFDGYGDEEEEVLSRHRRAANTVSNVTFYLEKKDPHNDTTEMKIGTKIGFRLTIHFPPGDTDMLVELFTPDNASTVMMLCDVVVNDLSGNTNLQFNGSKIPSFFSLNNSVLYDRAVIDFGIVRNSDSDNSDALNNQIIIEYSAVMIQNDDTQNGSTYWVSAGAEYNNDEYVWVGQARFMALLEAETFAQVPTFNFTGPSSMAIGSAAVFQVDMFIPYPSVLLSFDAFVPINTSNVMSVCGIKAKDVAVNYECGFDYQTLKSDQFHDGQTRGYKRGHLEIGVVTNKGIRDATYVEADSRITVVFVVFMYKDEAIVGNSFWVGAALQIGADQIWAGQIEIIAAALENPADNPTFAITGDSTLSLVKHATIELTATMPSLKSQEYELEILTPYDNGAILQICSLKIKEVGEHIPCLQKDLQAVYSSRSGSDSAVPDRALLSLGRVSNVGSWGWVNSSVSTQNDVTFQILVKATNHTAAATGSEHTITIGVIQSGTKIYVGTKNVTVTASSPIDTEIVNESVPLFNLKYGDGFSEYVEVGTATVFVYEMQTKRDVSYPMMDMEFIMPNDTAGDGRTPISVCRTAIKSVGKNIVCVTKSVVNKGITYDSRYNDDLHDRTIISLGALCNSEIVSGNDTTEDTLVIETIVQMEEHTNNINGTLTWLSAGTMYSPTRMWVGQLAVFPLANGVVATTATPTILLVKNSSLTTIPVGYYVYYNLVIKSPPGEHVKYAISITSTTSDLSICQFRLVAIGDNLPCVKMTTTATYDHDDALGIATKASIYMNFVSNVGTTPLSVDEMFDDNTLLFQIGLHVKKDATLSTKPFTVLVNHNGVNKNLQEDIAVTADTSAINTTVGNVSTMQFSVGQIYEDEVISNKISPGQTKRLVVDVSVPEGVTQNIVVKVMAPIDLNGVVVISEIVAISIGSNMPCLHRKLTKADYLIRNATTGKIEIASLDLGYVCNSALSPGNDSANLVRIHAFVTLLNVESVTDGQTLSLYAAVNTNDQEIALQSLDLAVSKNFTDIRHDNMSLVDNSAIKVNITDDPIYLSISEKRVFPVVLYIPVNTSLDVKFDVDLPTNDSAVMTFLSLQVTGSGRNLVGYKTNNNMKINARSSQNTTQMNKVYCSLGIVTNTGWTYEAGENIDEDDTISLELELQLADSALNTNGSEHWISLGIKVGIYIVILEHKVVVFRDGEEKPNIEFTALVDSVNSTSTTLELDTVIRHANTSKAEGQNLTAILYFPPFMNFSLISWSNDSRIPYTASEDGKSLHIHLDRLYFTDYLGLTIVLITNGEKVPAGITGTNIVSNMEVVSKINKELSTDDFAGEMSYVTYNVDVFPKTKFVCVTTNLGMESGQIQNCQVRASIETIAGGEASLGRLGSSGNGWIPFVRGGKLKEERFYQVYFGNATLVQKIHVNVSDSTNAISKIKTTFSNDGYAWIDGETISITTPYSLHIQDLTGSDPYRYMRVYMLDNATPLDRVGVKFEFYGCMVGGDVALSDVCTTVAPASPTPSADFHRRGFLALTDGTVYVCDSTIYRGLTQACFRSTDGATWEELDSRLACMVGHDVHNNRIYGMASDGVSFMASSDSGVTWESCRADDVTKSKESPDFKQVKVVPWTDDANLKFSNPKETYKAEDWGATNEGLKKWTGTVWEMKMDWSSCCS